MACPQIHKARRASNNNSRRCWRPAEAVTRGTGLPPTPFLAPEGRNNGNKNAGFEPSDHFARISKMVPPGSGAIREVDCVLIHNWYDVPILFGSVFALC
jgi:hypothetical protein